MTVEGWTGNGLVFGHGCACVFVFGGDLFDKKV